MNRFSLQLDDVQWCDAETLAWLHFLLRCTPNARLMIVGSLRSEEGDSNKPLANWRMMLGRSELLTNVELGALDVAETSELAAHLRRRRLTPDEAARVYGETEGHPLFIVDLARCGQTGADAYEASTHPQLPARIQSVFEDRLAALSPETRALASMAAVVGQRLQLPCAGNRRRV